MGNTAAPGESFQEERTLAVQASYQKAACDETTAMIAVDQIGCVAGPVLSSPPGSIWSYRHAGLLPIAIKPE